MRMSRRMGLFKRGRTWVWNKYTIASGIGYSPVEGASTTVSRSAAFYAGTEYTFNRTTGEFTVSQTVNIARSSTGATTAVGKFYVSFQTASGTYTGPQVYKITAASYSMIYGLTLTVIPYTTEYGPWQEPGSFIGTVSNANIDAYPMDGVQGGYWYMFDKAAALAGLFADLTLYAEARRSDNTAGTLTLNYTNPGTPLYCFFMVGNSYCLSKIVNGQQTIIKSVGNFSIWTSSNRIETTSGIYAGSIALVTFPNYTSEEVDLLLTWMEMEIIKAVYSDSGAYLRFNKSRIKDDARYIYFVNFVDMNTLYMSFSTGAEVMSPVSSYPGERVYLYNFSSTQYATSANGTSEVRPRVGGIYELVLP